MVHNRALQNLLRVFAELGINYRLVGSVAGYLMGNPRSTIDVDLVADIKPEQVPLLA